MNKIILIGNLSKNPELSETKAGKKVVDFDIAVSRDNETTDFFHIFAWEKLAESCAKYLKKGSKVGICGELQTRTYETKEGVKKYITEIRAQQVDFLTPKADEDEEARKISNRG